MKKLNKIKNYSLKAAKIGKKKKAKGFTLVELIVVIAIIGVLAAVLIPTMSGKVRDSRIATANDKAAKIAEQAGIIATEMETTGGVTVTDLTNKVYTAAEVSAADQAKTDFKDALEKALPDIKGKKVYIKFTDEGGVEKVVYAEDTKTHYVGQYPTQTTKETYKELTFNKAAGIKETE